MNRILELILIGGVITACSQPEQITKTPWPTKGLHRYSLDTNYFKVIETANQRDELIVLGPAGEKEASYTYDNYGLVRIKNYEGKTLIRERYLENIDSISSIRLIDTKYFPNKFGAFTNGYIIDMKNKSVDDNLPSDYFYITNPIDTLNEGQDYNLMVDTKNIKGKDPNYTTIKKIVYDLNENYAYTDVKQVKIKKLLSDTINYLLETKTPGNNFKRLILFLLEKDPVSGKMNNEVQSFIFEFKYFVRPKKEIGPYLDNFRDIFKEKIINDK